MKNYNINKYHSVLKNIIANGKRQENKKGGITYLLNQQLTLTPRDLLTIFESHSIARKKLRAELELYLEGEVNIDQYNKAGITWWDYCTPQLVNSYPTYFKKLPTLAERINREKRNSKNYVLFIGETEVTTNQAPCLSLIQFQIDEGELVISAYQRSSDANLGLPSDLYHLYLVSQMIDVPLKSITLYLGNVHIYDSNMEATKELLSGAENVRFSLNVQSLNPDTTEKIRA